MQAGAIRNRDGRKPARARPPSLLAMASFLVRSKGLQVRRAASDMFSRSPRLKRGRKEEFPFVLAESVSALNTNGDPRERPLLLGKMQNLRLACRHLDRRILLPSETFSFWRQVGPAWRSRGFAVGREMRDGCVIPTTGGGLCQLSGSLLEVASALDLEVVERHRHSALPSDVLYEARRDATLFWNYVDLRFRSSFPILFECYLTEDALVVRIRGKAALPPSTSGKQLSTAIVHQDSRTRGIEAESCFNCAQTTCMRHEAPRARDHREGSIKTAFLVDEYQPEFDAYIQGCSGRHDQILMPFSPGGGARGWSTNGFDTVRSFPWLRWWRAWILRRAVSRGVTVALAHFQIAQALSRSYERCIDYDVDHVCVSQTLLPHLWRSGMLGGRTFDVLMHRLPAAILEERLDHAARLYPHSKSLVEFRAPQWFVDAEEEALASARRMVTPHVQIAALFGNAVRLEWDRRQERIAQDAPGATRELIVFLGPTIARKGAYAVREAARKLSFPLTVLGSELEGADFWAGLPVTRATWSNLDWSRVHTVLQPALFEYWPRQLLRAYGEGCNLVVSPGCGFEEDRDKGIYHVPFGDASAVVAILETLLTNGKEVLCVD